MISSEAHLRQEEGRGQAASNLEHQPQDRPYAHTNAADQALTPVEKCLVPMVLQSQDGSLGLTEPNPDCGPLETQEKGLLPTSQGANQRLPCLTSWLEHRDDSAGRQMGIKDLPLSLAPCSGQFSQQPQSV